MKLLICFTVLMFSWLAIGTQSLAAVGDVKYISDELKVPLRSGPSSGHRIIHQGLPSGTNLTILATDEDANFTQIRTKGGLEGWVRTQYLIGEPIARVKLATAEKHLQNLKAKIAKERETHTKTQSVFKETQGHNTALNSQVESLTKKLAELKIVSADPIKEHSRNIELTQQNARLVEEVDELASKTKRLEDNVQLQWLLYGGALVLIGLLIGVILKARPKKQTSFSRYS